MKKLIFILILGSLFSQDLPTKSDIDNMNLENKILLYESVKLNSADYMLFPIVGFSKIGKLKKYFTIVLSGYTVSFLSMLSTYEILGGGLNSIEDSIIVGMSGGIATSIYLRMEFDKEIKKYNENLYKYIKDL